MNKVASVFAAPKVTLTGYYYGPTNAEDDVDSKLNVDENTVVPHFPGSVNDGNNEADLFPIISQLLPVGGFVRLFAQSRQCVDWPVNTCQARALCLVMPLGSSGAELTRISARPSDLL